MRLLLGLLISALAATPAAGQATDTPDRTRDRGDGLPLSMFGTYIGKGELVVYPFYEYYRDGDYEYEAGELGFSGTDELRSRYRAHEGLIFLAYGLTDNLAFEFEAATITAALDKSPADVSALPLRLEQSGIGDVEAQLRWRWSRESEARPEVFSYFETVFPVQRKKLLIGTSDFEFKFGTGIVRGYRWGTITARAAIAHADGHIEPGEFAFEYLRRLSSRLRLFAGVEGSEDEIEAIGEAQIFLRDNVVLKVNNAFGITPKAPGWAPEIGIVFRFP
jgi:hypothetical protein